ncbi:MAG: Rho termination factor N-terminal domain-containing protein [Desulfomonilaceae bacterium]
MTISQVRTKARDIGIKNITRYRKEQLIKTIQELEGNNPCYKKILNCGELGCAWRTDCQS